MNWDTMSDKVLIGILQDAIEANEETVKRCFTKPLAKVEKLIEKMKLEEEFLRTAEDKTSAVLTSRTPELINALYATYRQTLVSLCTYGQLPIEVDGLIDDELLEAQTVENLDKYTDGIFAFADGDMLRIRVPVLPHKSKPKIWPGSRYATRPITATGIYGTSLFNVLKAEFDSLKSVEDELTSGKTIHFLNVFSDHRFVMDNDNRDTMAIVNSIGLFFGGDGPETTRIMNDGYYSETLIPGTYITVLPYKKGIADNEETVNFWIDKLAELGYDGDPYREFIS